LTVQLVSKISNLCDPDPPTSQTDRRTTYNLNTALCTSASRGKHLSPQKSRCGEVWESNRNMKNGTSKDTEERRESIHGWTTKPDLTSESANNTTNTTAHRHATVISHAVASVWIPLNTPGIDCLTLCRPPLSLYCIS